MSNFKRRRLEVPSRWLNCPRLGNIVNDLFVPFKTPLDEKFDKDIPISNRFNLPILLSSKKLEKVGLIINLTNTEKYYNTNDIAESIEFIRLSCEGHHGAPTVEQVNGFINVCANFFDRREDFMIGVHCTHGYNRTGFMIVSYLFERCDIELDTAVQLFAIARPPGIYKQMYLDELVKRYDYDDGVLSAPDPPDWNTESGEEDSSIPYDVLNYFEDQGASSDQDSVESEKSTDPMKHIPKKSKKSVKKPYVVPKVAAFMEGVSGVSVVYDVTVIEEVQEKVRELMSSTRQDFVGSQPVSMTRDNIFLLKSNQYRVSWKADGTRYMMLIADKDLVYMFDRDNCVYKVENINFPKSRSEHLSNTLLDGEMVIDLYQNKKFPRYLIYDIMNISQIYVGDQQFLQRMTIIQNQIIDPRTRYVTSDMRKYEPFGVRAKDFWPLEKTKEIWEGKFRQQLCHRMDGLIFQPAGPGDIYTIGRCTSMLKWKPPELNSIDFQLRCQYVQEKNLVPRFVGFLYVSGEKRHFAAIDKIAKDLREKYDNKIVECSFNPSNLEWQIMRERTDKSLPNHISTAQAVFDSMQYPVLIDDLYNIINSLNHR